MKALNLIFILFSLIVLFSCEKDENKIYAGQYDSNFIYYDYTPDLELTFIRDEELLTEIGKDSIDVDMDGTYDVVMYLKKPDVIFDHCELQLRNGFQVAICKESYGIGHGQSQVNVFVDTLKVGTKINDHLDWSGNDGLIDMWYAVSVWPVPSYGSWYYTKSNRYIGIKSDKGKYGWIEVDATDPNNPKVLRYAFQK